MPEGDSATEGRPAFSLPGDGSDVTPQVQAASSVYPYHEKAIGAAALACFALACTGPLLEQFPTDGPLKRAMTVGSILFFWVIIILLALWPLLGERGIWRMRGWVGSAARRARGRLGELEGAALTGLALYGDRLEWGGGAGRHAAGGSAPYSRVAYALFYGDLLLVSLRMSPQHLPEVVADASSLGARERRELARFLEGRVNAARRTREYRRSVPPDSWATGASGRLAWGLWRCTAYGLSLLFVPLGAWALAGALAGEPALATPSAALLSLFMLLVGLALLDGLGGRSLCVLRRHPTRRRLRVGRVRRRRPVAGDGVARPDGGPGRPVR